MHYLTKSCNRETGLHFYHCKRQAILSLFQRGMLRFAFFFTVIKISTDPHSHSIQTTHIYITSPLEQLGTVWNWKIFELDTH